MTWRFRASPRGSVVVLQRHPLSLPMTINAILVPAIAPISEHSFPENASRTFAEPVASLLQLGLDGARNGLVSPENIICKPCQGMNVAAGGVFYKTFHAFVLNDASESDYYNEKATRLSGFTVRGPAVVVRIDGDGQVSSAFAREVIAVLSITG